MEPIAASIKSVKDQLSKPRAERSNATLVQELAKCAVHYRVELIDADYEIYLEGLRDVPMPKIMASLKKCLTVCEFMPRIKDIIENLPEDPAPPNKKPELKVIREWDEDGVRYTEYENGYRQVKFIK